MNNIWLLSLLPLKFHKMMSLFMELLSYLLLPFYLFSFAKVLGKDWRVKIEYGLIKICNVFEGQSIEIMHEYIL